MNVSPTLFRPAAHAYPAADIVCADVGGTHTRIALARPNPGGACPVELLHTARYACAEWPGLGEIVADFLDRLAVHGHAGRPSAGVLACAGYVQDDHVINVNLPWSVSLSSMRERLGIAQLAVINDFGALAHAVPHVTHAAMRTLLDGAGEPGGLAAGPIVVMGPGTGMGCAAVLPGARYAQVLPTEAAHIALAPGTPREMDILRVLSREHAHVAVEHALSGPGLLKLYRAIAELRGEPARIETPAGVSAAALAVEPDPAALEALNTFCELLGSFAADLAVVYRASGGVLLAGGILPQLEPFLRGSAFGERFLRKGVMVPFLRRVPVRMIDHGDLGIIGAACWWLQQAQAPARR